MKIYQVGGSVRDEILKEKSIDKDFVVVGATVEEFLNKFPNAERVGNSFPVFLVGREEYAFARKEKKNGTGYTGFDFEACPEITLEEDLKRRDLTINAIAKDIKTGELIDPFGGIKDLFEKRIVHVTEAFAEDPLRVYRVARFAAKFYDFSIDEKTIEMMNSLKGELSTISVERVWGESLKAFSSKAPERFFTTLDKAGVLDSHFKELADLKGVPAGPVEYHPDDIDTFHHTMNALKRVSSIETGSDPFLIFSLLCHDFGKALTNSKDYPRHHGHDQEGLEIVRKFSNRLKVPKKFAEAAYSFTKNHMKIRRIFEMTPSKGVKLVATMQKFPSGVSGFLKCVEADSGKSAEDIRVFVEAVSPALKVPLPEKWHNLGKKSAEMLNQLRCEKYRELKEAFEEKSK
ncbi:MAG: HD domain-containing protein [bacterium]